ncbi:m7GpppX diphosphatase [Smittium culicis]|uniref:m7GpppX diphosphatase n=1 Tax=Smittium culicis TaxID=133412 RepID=A0A1R1Y8F6_9FUNG|nr:m7GpppX diphosphatase [Smittium culicis]
MYKSITVKYIDQEPLSRIQWVYNILEGKAETERVIYKDDNQLTGFVLLPDFKWDETSLSNLYYVAFVNDKAIRTLRDINGSHLNLLKNIKSKAIEAISSKHPQFNTNQLSFYVHYQPSYYLFHVHITNVHIDSAGNRAGRAHLLETIIDNVENIDPNYYQKASIPIVLGENHPLYLKLTEPSQE